MDLDGRHSSRTVGYHLFSLTACVTLGMVGAQPSLDEDYLVLNAPDGRPTAAVAVIVQKPAESVARRPLCAGEQSLPQVFYARLREGLWPHTALPILAYVDWQDFAASQAFTRPRL